MDKIVGFFKKIWQIIVNLFTMFKTIIQSLPWPERVVWCIVLIITLFVAMGSKLAMIIAIMILLIKSLLDSYIISKFTGLALGLSNTVKLLHTQFQIFAGAGVANAKEKEKEKEKAPDAPPSGEN